MFKQKYNTLIVVQNDDVYWFSGHHDNVEGQAFQLPLDQVLDWEKTPVQLPQWLKGKHTPLCIIPDHWFGSQGYPFRSKKPSLIEPFLERKLATANPEQEEIQQFFNYRHIGDGKDQELAALFLQEDKSYKLYTALGNLNHIPRQITAPAFLWEERLGHVDENFNKQGTLLVHHAGQECNLYFYHNGIYQFSRIVALPDSADDIDALGFEINQSLYMFSQKAKSDLDRIYMLCDESQSMEKLSESVGREIIDLKPLMDQGPETAISPEMEIFSRLLHKSQINCGASLFGVCHRQMKKTMEWKPVQWTGICIGLILLIGIACEQFFLSSMLTEVHRDHQRMQQQVLDGSSTASLSDSSTTLEQVLSMANQSKQAYVAHHIPSGFPTGTRLKELDYRFEHPSTVNITATMQARNADELQVKLSQLIAQMKEKFKDTRAIRLNDIDISIKQSYGSMGPSSYQIAFQLELT